jgi:hypothetical protein
MKTLTALLTKIKLWLCSYICDPDEHEDVSNVEIVTINRGDEDE